MSGPVERPTVADEGIVRPERADADDDAPGEPEPASTSIEATTEPGSMHSRSAPTPATLRTRLEQAASSPVPERAA
jgi:hypothetical protein